MQIDQLMKEFLFHCEVERGLSPHTLDAYRHDLLQFVGFVGAASSLEDAFSVDRLKDFLQQMKIKRGLSPSTIRRRLACLRSLTTFATEQFGANNPFNEWRPRIKREKRLPRALHRGDVHQLLDGSDGHDDEEIAFAIMLLGATGLRVSELCSVRICDVSDDGSTIRVNGKGARERFVYVTNPRLLQRMQRRLGMRRGVGGNAASLLVNARGNAMSPQTLRRRLHRYTRRVGLERKVTPHMLRHTAATLLLEEGADIRFVQRLLGHASIATTEIYTHVSDSALRDAIMRADTMRGLLEV